MRIFTILTSFFIFSNLFSQTDLNKMRNYDKDSVLTGYSYLKLDSTICSSSYDSVQDREVFWYVDKMPMYGDSISDILNYIQRNIKYPVSQIDIVGRVYLRFIIEPNGKLTNIKILRGIDPLIDKEAIEVIKNMPDWKAGECDETKVPVYFTVPVNFTIN